MIGDMHFVDRDDGEDELIGESPGLLAAKDLARAIARTEIPVLILGETGTGKELLARYIHRLSGRTGQLVDIDCGALPDDLFESLLFGHRRGAFTGATEHRTGLVAQAQGGTLFLDELASLAPRAQAKLLRVLETGEVRRVGEARSRQVEFRLISTAQPSLGKHVTMGAFREDLVQRVAGVVIELPSLAERVEDISILARRFAHRRGIEMSEESLQLLIAREWPGNVRQLRWTIARCAIFASDGEIDGRAVRAAAETGPARFHEPRPPDPAKGQIAVLTALCRRHEGEADRIAEALGVGRSTLYRRLKNAGLSLRSFKRTARAI